MKTTVKKALEKMGFTDCTPVFHQTSENTTFIIKKEDIPLYTLRISRKNSRTPSQLEGELKWMKAIKGVNMAEPISEILDIDGYFCVFFKYIDGEMPSYNDEEVLYNIGKIAAQLHKFADMRLDRPVWSIENMTGRNGLWGDWRKNDELTYKDREVIEKALSIAAEKIKEYDSPKYGLIHADLRITNIIQNDKYYAIDFDDCGYGYFMQDIAAALSFMENSENIEALKSAWFRGYEEITPLDTRDREIADSFILLRKIQLLAWVTSHTDSEYVQGIRKGFGAKSVATAVTYLNKSYNIM